ncbi:glycerate kinase type-2 family protein [Halorarum halobium]|uniref:glycerate kinase type-2 family protein n=1 Tax=Halorarum halobium TaxID=3075121 RepID=UPI0028B25813|nr:DUF4147 domain-containing protein [Halobaculum sp. XH14]
MIENRDALGDGDARELALDCVAAAIEAASPERATRDAVSLDGDVLAVADAAYDLSAYEDVLVVGGGKAAHGVASALESVLGDRITDGLVVTKHDADLDRVRPVTGDHPLPTERNVEATTELLDTLAAAGSGTLVLFVVTGGASSLLTAPAGDLTVEDVRATTEQLLEGGAPIDAVNGVRKHLSAVKGGRAARAAAPATVVTLALSDVVGNDLSTVGSGPTVPDDTTFSDALATFDRHGLTPSPAVSDHLEAGVAGRVAETPFGDDPTVGGAGSHLLCDNAVALEAARSVAADAGHAPVVLSSRLRGEAREVGTAFAGIAEECAVGGDPVEPPAVILAGGECTVTVADDPGEGGPNQEFVLSGALALTEQAVVAAVDTDGEDGSSDVAGAIADHGTVGDADRARASEHLDANDAGTYLSPIGATIRTGPTGTNVNDVMVAVVPEREE